MDGPLKVTGAAKYAAEFKPPGLAYGALVQSTVAAGRIVATETAEAERVPGVFGVLTLDNMPRLAPPPGDLIGKGQPGENFAPLQDARVFWAGQHLAVVIAETPAAARHAAGLVRVIYEETSPRLRLEDGSADVEKPELWAGREKLQVSRGDAARAWQSAPARVEATYETPVMNHHPIEMVSTTAHWETPGRLKLYDTTRWVKGIQRVVAHAFSLSEDAVRVVCPFTGGAFGSKGFQWQHILLAAAAARLVGRPVRVEFTRAQMATTAGRRERTRQTLALGAEPDGQLRAIRHDTLTASSPLVEYTEPCGNLSRNLYAVPAAEVTHRLVRLNQPSPCPMRAPGEAPGMFALECAMDELAASLDLDPLELRLRNHAETDAHEHKPYSAKYLGACYHRAAERFGWARRDRRPGSMTTGDSRLRLGWGMATAAYPAKQMPASARATLRANGSAEVRSATHEQGTGTYTAMTHLAADALGLPPERVSFALGDSRFPVAPVNGGSWLSSSVGPAVLAACAALVRRLGELAAGLPGSPLAGAKPEELTVADGRVFLRADPTRGLAHAEILVRAGLPLIEAEAGAKPGEDAEKFAHLSFGAHFAEVVVDPDLGEVRVRRFVGCYDVGRILNSKLARSQLLGGIAFGLSMALHEGSWPDPGNGRTVNADLSEYHVPTCADVPADIAVEFVGQDDPHFAGGFGAHGVGELGIVGSAAAVANAVFHATGRRVRDLPITPDKLL